MVDDIDDSVMRTAMLQVPDGKRALSVEAYVTTAFYPAVRSRVASSPPALVTTDTIRGKPCA